MVSEQEEGREHHVLFLHHLSVYGQDLRRLTGVRLAGLVGLDSDSSHRVVYDCEGGWMSDQIEART